MLVHNKAKFASLSLRCLGEYFYITVIFHKPNLNSRVHVIVDIIVFQHAMTIVIEVDPNLFKQQRNFTFIPGINMSFMN